MTAPATEADAQFWASVRGQFDLAPDWVHLGTSQFLASHPAPVREAIQQYRQQLDANPVEAIDAQEDSAMEAVRAAAARYLAIGDKDEIALTDSTTMGMGLFYTGFPFRAGDEIVISDHEHYSHREAVRGVCSRAEIAVQRVKLYEGSAADVTEEGLVAALMGAVGPRTRIVATTWVHSDTGLKFPVARLARAIAQANAGRDAGERILLVVDGVHGLGIETDTIPQLGCDVFVAGTHKWMYGPRGTGLLWMGMDDWRPMRPVIPSFTETMDAYSEDDPLPPMDGRQFTPGGFHSLEHRWAATAAFEFHEGIGRERVAERVRMLNRLCKEGLAAMDHVVLHTPMGENLSSGIAAFEIPGMDSSDAEAKLREKKITGTVAPYPSAFLRFTPGIINTPADVEAGLEAVRSLGRG
jgi:isopenicillin-N epimerase